MPARTIKEPPPDVQQIIPAWIRNHHWIVSGAIALILLLSIGRVTGITQPTNDSMHYLNIAHNGLWNNPSLAAPFAYRPGTPLLVRLLYGTTIVSAETGFAVIAFLSAWALLIATYMLARSMNGGLLQGLAVMCTAALSFFQVKFPLAAPTRIDVEAFFLITLAAWLLVKNRPGLVLLISCGGLFFKEFLIIPGALLLVAKVEEYLRTRTTEPLVWLIASICLLFACFTIPRIVIPVSAGYGDNFCWDLSTASHLGYLQNLRHFLSGWPDPEKLTNIAFSLCSYWLPVVLLVTPARARTVWQRLSHLRRASIAHVVMVLALSAIGGTNVMIFVVYSGPVMTAILTLLLATDVYPLEAVLMLGVACVFNRIPWVVGGVPAAEDITSFYAGWGSVVDMTTLHRSLEMALYLAVFIALRFILDRFSRDAVNAPA